jgi:uncharacterized protein (DUF3084 family)
MLPVALRVFLIYLVVAVIAGLIAYLGNQLGRKIGRKKMSVFGMRPKKTSNFITTLTGSLIAIATLTLFAIFSEQVRYVLTGIDQLEKRLVILQSQVKRYEEERARGRITYGVGEPILLGTLNPSLGPDRLRSQILAALSAANAQAVQKNNKVAAEQHESLQSSEEQLLQWNDVAVQKLIGELENRSEVVGIRIEASQNCLYKDKVPVDLKTVPVTLVFHEGEIVASKTLQPNQPQILREWYDFLDEMRNNALRKGMVPINDSLGGGISDQDFSRLLQDLENLKEKATVVAIARRDLYQTSPLDVKVEVRKAQAMNNHHESLANRRGKLNSAGNR